MPAQNITNEILYELLKKLENDMERSFAGVERRLDEARQERQDIKTETRENFKKAEAERQDIKTETRENFKKAEAERQDIKTEAKESLQEVKHDLRRYEDRLDEVYDARKEVTVRFTRAWGVASFLMVLAAFALAKVA